MRPRLKGQGRHDNMGHSAHLPELDDGFFDSF